MDILKSVLGIGNNVSNFFGGLINKGKKKLQDFEQDPLRTAISTAGDIGSAVYNNPFSAGMRQQQAANTAGQIKLAQIPGQAVRSFQYDGAGKPAVDFLKETVAGILDSPANFLVGKTGLEKQGNTFLQTGQAPRVQDVLGNVAKMAELPLNLVGGGGAGSVVKGIGMQGFKALGKQGLWQAVKEGAVLGGKYGLAAGAIQGGEEGTKINDTGDYLTNLAKDMVMAGAGGVALGGVLGGGGYGLTKAVSATKSLLVKGVPGRFATDIAAPESKYLNDAVIAPYRNAFSISGKTQSELQNAVADFQSGKFDGAIANGTLEASTKQFLPQYANKDTMTQAKIWEYILARKNGKAAIEVPPELDALDKQIFKVVGFDMRQAGFLRTKEFTDLFDKTTKTAKTQEEGIQGLTASADKLLGELAPAGQKITPTQIKDLKAMRAALNKQAYGVAGVNPAAGKGEKAAYEIAKQDPDAGPFIAKAEEYIAHIDDVMEKAGGSQNAPVLDLIKAAKTKPGAIPELMNTNDARAIPFTANTPENTALAERIKSGMPGYNSRIGKVDTSTTADLIAKAKGGNKYSSAVEAMQSPEMQAKYAKIKAMQTGGKVTKTSSNLYHTTPATNLDSIAQNGLTTGNPARFDGVSSPTNISFSANEAGAKYYGGANDVMIRTKTSYKPTDLQPDLLAGGDGTYVTTQNIPPSALEAKINGKWVSLDKIPKQATATELPIKSLVDPEELRPISDLKYNIKATDKSYTKGPVDVVETPHGYVVLDGRHRAVEALQSGEKTIKTNILSPEEALKKYSEDWPQLETILGKPATPVLPETPAVPPVPPVDVPPAPPAGTTQDLINQAKQRGFVGSVQDAAKVTKKTKAGVAGDYMPKPNQDLMGEAKALLEDGASIDFKNTQNLDQKVAATIQEALNLDKAGQHDAAANLFNNLAEQGTNVAKGLQAFSMLDKMSPEAIALSAAGKIKKFNLTAGKKIPELTGEQVKLIGDRIAQMDGLKGREKNIALNELQNTLDEFIPSTFADKAITVWKAGLLTSLRTHERNLLGNTVMGMAEVVKDLPASVMDMIMKAKTGKRSMTLTTSGMVQGGKKGATAMKDIVKYGYDPEETIAKFDIKKITWGKGPVEQFLKKATDTVFRPLAGEDKIFWHSSYARSLYDQAGAEAINAGKQGNKKFIEGLVNKPTEQMLKTALIDANTATFHDKNIMTSISSAIKRAASDPKYGKGAEIGKIVTEVTMPFTGVPSSIVGKTMAYSPIGLVKGALDVGKVLLTDVPDLQRKAAQEVGRGVVGTGLFGLGAYLMDKGLMTGQPKDATEAALWAAQGKQANSVMIAGQWRSINSIGPQNLMVLAGAKYQEEMGKAGGGDAGAYALGLGKDQLSQTFVQGMSGPINALTDPARYGKSYLGNTASSIVPNIVKDVSKAFDSSQRENNTFKDYIYNAIPGLRNTGIEKRDVLGNVMKQEPTGVGAFFDLFNSKTPIDNVVTNELGRLAATGNEATPSKQNATQTIRGEKVKLTFEQLNNLEAGVGEALKPQLETLIQSETYKNLSDEQKANAIDNIVKDVREKYKNINGADLATGVKGETSDQKVGKDQTYSYVDASGSYKTIDIGKVAKMPETTRYEKTLKENAAYKIVDDILDNLPKEQQAAALKSVGLDDKTASYYNVARQPDDVKTSYVLDAIDSQGIKSKSELLTMLYEGRESINGKMIVSNGVLDDFYDAGYISSAERTQLKKITLDSSKKQTAASKASGTGGASTAKTTAAMKAIAADIIKGPDIKSVDQLIAEAKKGSLAMAIPKFSSNVTLTNSSAAVRNLADSVPQTSMQNLIAKSKAASPSYAKARALIEKSRGASPSSKALTLKFGGSRR